MRSQPANLATKVREKFYDEDRVPVDDRHMVDYIYRTGSHWYLSPTVMNLVYHTDLAEPTSSSRGPGYVEIDLKLPFESMTIEYPDWDVDFCLFAHGNSDLDVFALYSFIRRPTIKPLGYLGAILGSPGKGLRYVDPINPERSMSLTDSQFAYAVASEGQNPEAVCMRALGIVLRLCRILECDNAPVKEIPEPTKLNKKRESNGKIRIPTYRTLHISDHIHRPQIPTLGEKGTHASPRAHWRRGHIRHMTVKGEEVRRWIKPTIVGGGIPDAPNIRIT